MRLRKQAQPATIPSGARMLAMLGTAVLAMV
jgi:hypothetical protein